MAYILCRNCRLHTIAERQVCSHCQAKLPDQPKSAYVACLSCGLPNIPERQTCKHCHADMRTGVIAPSVSARVVPPRPPASIGSLAPPTAYTATTGTLYISHNQQHRLLLNLHYLEYCGPGITLASVWANVADLRAEGVQPYLLLRAPAALTQIRSTDPTLDAWRAQTVPLHCFGYPQNPQLRADLRRFAPWL